MSLGTPEFYGGERKETETSNQNAYSGKGMKIVRLFTHKLLKIKPNEKSSSSIIFITTYAQELYIVSGNHTGHSKGKLPLL